jgi:hypothetical protein
MRLVNAFLVRCCFILLAVSLSFNSAAADAIPYDGFLAVWALSDTDRKFGSFKDEQDVRERNAELEKNGYRIVWLNRGRSNPENFQVIWAKKSGESMLGFGLAQPIMKMQNQMYYGMGFRLLSLGVAARDDKSAYFPVWRKADGGQHWRTGLTTDEFKEADLEYFKLGYRIVSLQRDMDNEVTAVWRRGSGEQWWHSGMNFRKLKSKMKHYSASGLHLVTVDRNTDGEYTAVWRSGGPSNNILVDGYSKQKLMQKNGELEARGYQMIVLRGDVYRFELEDKDDDDDNGGSSGGGSSCGSEGQSCCTRDHCKLGTACNTQSNRCEAVGLSGCGAVGHSCCAPVSGNPDGCSGANCIIKVCQPCGGENQDCCIPSSGAALTCAGGYTCNGAICKSD